MAWNCDCGARSRQNWNLCCSATGAVRESMPGRAGSRPATCGSDRRRPRRRRHPHIGARWGIGPRAAPRRCRTRRSWCRSAPRRRRALAGPPSRADRFCTGGDQVGEVAAEAGELPDDEEGASRRARRQSVETTAGRRGGRRGSRGRGCPRRRRPPAERRAAGGGRSRAACVLRPGGAAGEVHASSAEVRVPLPPRSHRPSRYPPAGRRASSSSATRAPRSAARAQASPPFDRYAVIPVARNVWQHVEGGNPAAAARRLVIARTSRRSGARQPPLRRVDGLEEHHLRRLEPARIDVGVKGRRRPVGGPRRRAASRPFSWSLNQPRLPCPK